MKKYRLAIKYPSLQKEFEEGDMVYYNGLSNVYVRARSPHYSIDVNEVENNPDFWELIEKEEPLNNSKYMAEGWLKDPLNASMLREYLEVLELNLSKIQGESFFRNNKPNIEPSIDKVTTTNLDIALRMAGIHLDINVIDKIIDLVELIENKGDSTSTKDVASLQEKWLRHSQIFKTE